MPTSAESASPLMAALKQFEATEANMAKLERLWEEIMQMVPNGPVFGENPEYEDRTRAYEALLVSLPKIDGWKPEVIPCEWNEMAHNRLDALEIGEIEAQISVEDAISAPGKELREYRFRLNNKRKALIRDALVGLIDQVDEDLRAIREIADRDLKPGGQLDAQVWTAAKDHLKQIEVLLGSEPKPLRWSDMQRHMHFGYDVDLRDIEKTDWPDAKATLRKGLYGVNEAVPVEVDDLSSLVAAHPKGPIAIGLAWSSIDDEKFERLVFTMLSNAPGYENPEWLMLRRRIEVEISRLRE